MKSFVVMFLLLFQIAMAAPKLFTGGRELCNGMGENQASAVYEFKGPYALRWTLRDVKPRPSEDTLAAYWKPHTVKNPPWVSIRVMDAASRKVVAHEMVTAWESTFQVETGGKHYLIVTGEQHVAWTIWGKDGILADNGDGIRKATDQDMGSMTVQDAAATIVAALKKQHQGTSLEERVNAVTVVQSRASSTADFLARWKAYCKVMKWE
jgi:hypothetical protein